MEAIINSILNKRDVILTASHGFKRSRVLIRSELHTFVKCQSVGSDKKESPLRIIHICDKDYQINRIHDETRHMPFQEFGIKIARAYGDESDENKSDTIETCYAADLVVCHLKHIFRPATELNLKDALLIFDVISLESIEGACNELYEQNNPGQLSQSPSIEFKKIKDICWSVIIACNPPHDGLLTELGLDRSTVIIDDKSMAIHNYRTCTSILTNGPSGSLYDFGSNEEGSEIHKEVGAVLRNCCERLESGGIVVFFPSYGRMVEYHNAWKQSGLFEQVGLPYVRENRAGTKFKDCLLNSARQKKWIFLFSIRYHQDELLAEFVLSLARAAIVVGLPYPFTSDTWDARIRANDELKLKFGECLAGAQLYKYRGIEFMNGVVKRCLNEYRHKDCCFFLLDSGLKCERERIASELGDIQEETYYQSEKRYVEFLNR